MNINEIITGNPDKLRIIQELVPGKQITLAHIIAAPDKIVYQKLGLNPDIDYNMNFTFNKAQKRTVNVALSNTFGFGGHNASIAFKKIED